MVPIILDGAKTNISQFTVDHAGPKELLQLLETDLTFYQEIKIQLQLISMLKLSLTLEQEVHAKVETQEVFTNMLLKLVSQIHLANNTLLKILMAVPNQLIFAKIAHGHHAQPMKLAKINVGLLTINTIMQATTTL